MASCARCGRRPAGTPGGHYRLSAYCTACQLDLIDRDNPHPVGYSGGEWRKFIEQCEAELRAALHGNQRERAPEDG